VPAPWQGMTTDRRTRRFASPNRCRAQGYHAYTLCPGEVRGEQTMKLFPAAASGAMGWTSGKEGPADW